jgi:hypothetical protein
VHGRFIKRSSNLDFAIIKHRGAGMSKFKIGFTDEKCAALKWSGKTDFYLIAYWHNG